MTKKPTKNKNELIVEKKVTPHHGDLCKRLIRWLLHTDLEFAHQLGVDRMTVYHWKRKETLTLGNIERICQYAGVPKEYFMGTFELPTKGLSELNSGNKRIELNNDDMQKLCKELENLKSENCILQEKLVEKDKLTIQLQQKIISLQDRLIAKG